MDKHPTIIAVDFDGTLCANAWPDIGAPNESLINYLKIRKINEGVKLILWTCRAGEKLNAAIEWCQEYDLTFDAVNENLPEIVDAFDGDSRKIFANEYLDDKSTTFFNLPFEVTPNGTMASVKYAYEDGTVIGFHNGLVQRVHRSEFHARTLGQELPFSNAPLAEKIKEENENAEN